jgi:hypothetical protein
LELAQLRKILNGNRLFRSIASVKLAVFLIIFLMINIIAGTLEQSANGLYQAREKYFDAYLSFLGVVPIPGTLTILWLLTINLICSMISRFKFKISNTGLLMSHLGLILLFISGFFHFYYSKESFMSLKEEEKTSISQSYDNWVFELKSFDSKINKIDSQEIKLNNLKTRNFRLKPDIDINLVLIYKNAKVFHTPFAGTLIKEFKVEKDNEKNIPAIKLLINKKEYFLDGEENSFLKENINDQIIILELKRQESTLPFSVKLIDVTRKLYPNSFIAKSYASQVIVNDGKLTREARISMNKPLRVGLYTLYQSRYLIDMDGNEISTFAVVKNLNYQLPYWATLLINLGLLIHFVFAFKNYRKKRIN